jgi:hypothetical protein
LVFYTGLTADSFAKQKLSYLLTLRGCVLRGPPDKKDGPDGVFIHEEWQAEGVKEENGFMTVHGRSVGGERLDVLLEGGRNTALSAVLFWRAGLLFLLEKGGFEKIAVAPCAVFIDLEKKTLFFPPSDLIRIAVDGEGENAWLRGCKRWIHPDRKNADAVNWAASACLYRVFAGVAPFTVPQPEMAAGKKDTHTIEDTLAGDVREGALVPLALAAPGLHKSIAGFIDAKISRNARRPANSAEFPVINENAEENFSLPDETEIAALKARREALEQKNQKQIQRKRFLARNRNAIKAAIAGVIVVGFFVGSLAQARLERWTTKGLTPAQVVERYYGAFGDLDHEVMSACALKNAGKTDIEMVTNLFVIAKMREAYEQRRTVLNAADWYEAGPPLPDTTVFGVIRLAVDWPGGGADGTSQADTVTARARYDLVVPQSFVDGSAASVPVRVPRDDTLRLQRQKNRWRITEIGRGEPAINVK